MGAADAVMWALERNWDMVGAALEGMDDETMTSQPAEHCNSIAWILWHMNRVVDILLTPGYSPNLSYGFVMAGA